jgi:hypothetical protein
MQKITHIKVEVLVEEFLCNRAIGIEVRVYGIEGVVCEGGQAEDDDGQDLEYAISGGQNIAGVTVHTAWQILMITTHRGIAGIWSIPARPSRIFEVS